MTNHASVAIRPFLLKPQHMNGLSERLLVSHYENNYGGALRRLNAIQARLATLDRARTSGGAVVTLRQRGYDARALVGGITAWHAIGGVTVPLDTATYEAAEEVGS